MAVLEQTAVFSRTFPGGQFRTTQNLLAEIRADMYPVATAGHLASWGGKYPGNSEGAGKRKTGKTPGRLPLVPILPDRDGLAATRCKTSYYRAF